MGKTTIEWATHTWNPVMGCTPVSEGCANCYARTLIGRFSGRPGWPDSPDAVALFPERLEQPVHWRKPRRVFVCSMGDLFHEDVPDDFLCDVWMTMLQATQHTFMVLTKRPKRMYRFASGMARMTGVPDHIWIGVSVENQAAADERIPFLLQTPAAKRFVSLEPLLGPVDLRAIGRTRYERYIGPPEGYIAVNDGQDARWQLDLIITGAETGPGARPAELDWFRSLRDQCQEAGVPFFLKQVNTKRARELDGRPWEEWPI